MTVLDDTEACKHQHRVAFATGERSIPAWVDTDAVDECDCGDWNADADLPCWPCYRDEFDTPASADE